MNFIGVLKHRDISEAPPAHYVVVHPLDDVAEEKIDISKLGRMHMTQAVKLSLFALRGYLILMVCLVIYHVMALAGLFEQAKH
jgi:hypothetical protein